MWAWALVYRWNFQYKSPSEIPIIIVVWSKTEHDRPGEHETNLEVTISLSLSVPVYLSEYSQAHDQSSQDFVLDFFHQLLVELMSCSWLRLKLVLIERISNFLKSDVGNLVNVSGQWRPNYKVSTNIKINFIFILLKIFGFGDGKANSHIAHRAPSRWNHNRWG